MTTALPGMKLPLPGGPLAAVAGMAPMFQEIGKAVRTSASCADAEWCSSILFPKAFFGSEVIETIVCVLGTRRVTKRGELVRVDLNIDGLEMLPLKAMLRLLVRDAIGPFVEGLGKIVAEDSPEGLVVFLADQRKEEGGHEASPVMIARPLSKEFELEIRRRQDEEVRRIKAESALRFHFRHLLMALARGLHRMADYLL